MRSSLGCAVQCVMLLAAHSTAAAADPDPALIAMIVPRAADGTVSNAMPTDRELEGRNAHIGDIQIVVDDVFEQPQRLSAPYRIVNSLHVGTREATITQQLLFRHGDQFNRRVLAETERLLREQRYLNDASIEVVRYHDDNTVDVQVRVHDVWTLSPGFSFGRKGGENSSKVKFEDSNFLGLGKRLSLARSQDVDRSSWQLAYLDPHLFGSWWQLSTAHSTLSDGANLELQVRRPFYSLDSRWSAAVTASDSTTRESRYSLGKALEPINMHERLASIDAGVSRGLTDGWAKRYLFGLRSEEQSFMPTPDDPRAVLPENRRFVYPYVGLQWIEDAYVRTRNLDQIGRTEDLHLGRSLDFTAGWASSGLGSSRNALMLNASASAGSELCEGQYLTGTLGMKSRIEHDGLRNATLDVGGHYYLRQSEHRVLFAAADATWSSQLDPERQLLLGGDNGLRGYPLRYQAGASRALFTLEERFYTNWQPLKLVNVGAAIFVDAGRTWGKDANAAQPAGWLADAGIGLRLGSARSGLGNILHIDLALPLNRTSDIDGMQLLIETKRSF